MTDSSSADSQPSKPEPGLRGWLCALAISAVYLWVLLGFSAPAHPGVDQNGYLVGGRMLALAGSTATLTPDPFDFVGRMYITIDDQTHYPKYPLGLQAIYAASFLIFGDTPAAVEVAHRVSPVMMSLALLGIFALVRPLAGSMLALLGMIALGFSQLHLGLAINPNSHAAALAFVVWGMVLVFSGLRQRSGWRFVVAGFLLGFATLVRYTEGLLLLPLVMGLWSARRSVGWRWAGLSLLAWATPIAVQVAYNRYHYDAWTSYGGTNESTGFGVDYLRHNFDLVLRTLSETNLYLLFPLGLIGLVSLWSTDRRTAALLAAWFVPSAAVYAAYYWAPEGGAGYARFFVTQVPALIAATLVWAGRLDGPARAGVKWGLVLVVGLSGLVGVIRSHAPGRGGLEGSSRENTMLAELGRVVRATVPAGSLVLADEPRLHHFQFIGDWKTTSIEWFDERAVRRIVNNERDIDEPDPLDPRRLAFLRKMLEDKSGDDLREAFQKLVRSSIDSGRRVFVVLPVERWRDVERRLAGRVLTVREAARFDEPPPPMMPHQWLPDAERPRMPVRRGPGGRPMDESRVQSWRVLELLSREPPATPSEPPARGDEPGRSG
jgi:hypothetical protein